MSEFFAGYGLFLLEAVTIIGVLLLFVLVIALLLSRRQAGGGSHNKTKGDLVIRDLGEEYRQAEQAVRQVVMPGKAFKAWQKAHDQQQKVRAKKPGNNAQKTVYVIDFKGDIHASAVRSLREEISAVLAVARNTDEILVRLESAGGVVHGYGLAASQLQRIRDKGIPLTVSVDKVAASGGYMMACVANHVLAAPFAIIGSIGVIGQVPNFNRLLKKHDIDFEMHTAGAYKRTLTVFGENTPEAREKFIQDLNETHALFRNFVARFRPELDIAAVSTGEIWFGLDAMPRKLVDAIGTSDDWLQERVQDHRLVQVAYRFRQNLAQKAGFGLEAAVDRFVLRWLGRSQQSRFPS